MKKIFILLYLTLFYFISFAQKSDSLSLLFIGDVMGHMTQVQSAYDSVTKKYDYQGVFQEVNPIIKKADFAIANLEVTLGGEPYAGYPAFSSPDALAVACKDNGMDVLVTSNNHACDRSKKGILRTIHVLDSLNIKHTGTFKDSMDRVTNNLLILNKNNIKVGILNYTYGTNGLTAPYPTIVNYIDTALITKDIETSKLKQLDKLIVFLHWGLEYQSQPVTDQTKIAAFLFNKGIDIIIGSHPHVLEKMEYHAKTDSTKEQFIVYSLGNFVSDQRTRKRDGGAMVELVLAKVNNQTSIKNKGYYLTWVYKPRIANKTLFKIVPCVKYETNHSFMDENSFNTMKLFTEDSRNLFQLENVNVEEIKY